MYDENKNESRVIPWNFTKFVVNLEDDTIQYYNPRAKTSDIEKAIEDVLYKKEKKVAGG